MAKQDLMRTYLDLVVAGDLEGATSYYTDDVVLHWAGNGPISRPTPARPSTSRRSRS
jgi:ketosteroid isomerase-like protein